MMPDPAYLRLSNAPARFDVSEDTIRRWEAKGYISIYRRGGIALVKVAEVEAFIEGKEAPNAA